jgi:hypothetical protein
MNYSRSFLLLLLTLSTFYVARSQTGYVWTRVMGGPDYYDYAMDVECDMAGNAYVCGDYQDQAVIGGIAYSELGAGDVFVAKVDPFGTFDWVNVDGSNGFDHLHAIRLGHDAHIYTCGYTKKVYPPHRVTVHQWDASTIRISPAGGLVWGRTMNGLSGYSESHDIAVNAVGQSYTVGTLNPDGWWDLDTLYAHSNDDGFLVKFDSASHYMWSIALGGNGNDEGNAVDVDADGNVWVGGYFSSIGFFGTGNLLSQGRRDAYIAKFDPAGNLLFVKQIGGSGDEEITRLKVSADGNCYFVGHFTTTVSFPSPTLTSLDTTDIFYGKMDNGGNVLWAKAIHGVDYQYAQDLALDVEENIYISGFFFGDIHWQADSSASLLYDNAFWGKTDSNGVLDIFEVSRSVNDSRDFFGIAVDPAQNVLLTGKFGSSLEIGGDTFLSVNGTTDMFLTKYATRNASIRIDSVVGSPFCSSDQFMVYFTVYGYFEPGNLFTLELSNASGSFASPVAIGSVASGNGGVVIGTIPLGIVAGTGYRVRIHGSLPNIVSPDNGYDIALDPTTSIAVSISGDTVLCNGQPVTLNIDPGFVHQVWSTGDTTDVVSVTTPGVVWVEATDSNGCSNRDQVEVLLCIGIAPPQVGASLAVFPNPSSGDFRIHGKDFSIGRYALTVNDLQGRIVVARRFEMLGSAFETTVSLSDAIPGIYNLQLIGPKGSETLRLIVQ